MSDQFICISCWKEFAADEDEIQRRGGKVVCPYCGYIQPAPVGFGSSSDSSSQSIDRMEATGQFEDDAAEEIPWSTVAEDDYEVPVGDEEHTDRVEIPQELMDFAAEMTDEDIGMEEDDADEKTPVERSPLIDEVFDEYLTGHREPTDGVLMAAEEDSLESASPVDWQLRTPSGLTFKFTDPEALLGWKKKLATYQRLDVSPDGERWVDFARFVHHYEELGDPNKSFILSENGSETEESPAPRPVADEDSPDPMPASADQPSEERTRQQQTASGPQFTFRVKEEQNTGWGKYLLFAVIGLGLGAGIVVAVLYFTGILVF